MPRICLDGLDDCTQCRRLVTFMSRLEPAKGRVRNDYHNAPVNGFGDLRARICLVGLAPGAHGANRTGRPFTGDGAGDFMYPLLYRSGFSNRPEAVAADDGMVLRDLYITNAVKCLPPENRPNADEFANCRPYLEQELNKLTRLRVVIALGHGSHRSLVRLLQGQGLVSRVADVPFGHGVSHLIPNGIRLLGCYHTSRYNVQTGRMTDGLFLDLLCQAKEMAEGENG